MFSQTSSGHVYYRSSSFSFFFYTSMYTEKNRTEHLSLSPFFCLFYGLQCMHTHTLSHTHTHTRAHNRLQVGVMGIDDARMYISLLAVLRILSLRLLSYCVFFFFLQKRTDDECQGRRRKKRTIRKQLIRLNFNSMQWKSA